MDLIYLIAVSITVKYTVLIGVNGDCLLSTEVLQPQLSKTFLQGYWFEHLYINQAIQNESCSHILVKCNTSAATCDIMNQKWQSFYLISLWNGTLTQTTDEVQLNFTSNKKANSYIVNLKFLNDALLIWSCNGTEILFASTLFRMENNEDMKSIWEQANANMDFPEIIEETPAGVWKKAESTSCSNSGDNRYRDNTILFYLLLILNLSKISINFLFY